MILNNDNCYDMGNVSYDDYVSMIKDKNIVYNNKYNTSKFECSSYKYDDAYPHVCIQKVNETWKSQQGYDFLYIGDTNIKSFINDMRLCDFDKKIIIDIDQHILNQDGNIEIIKYIDSFHVPLYSTFYTNKMLSVLRYPYKNILQTTPPNVIIRNKDMKKHIDRYYSFISSFCKRFVICVTHRNTFLDYILNNIIDSNKVTAVNKNIANQVGVDKFLVDTDDTERIVKNAMH